MNKLVFGVTDIPHPSGDGMTTGKLAHELEDEFKLIGTFYDMHGGEVRDLVMKDFMRSLRDGEEFTAKRASQKIQTLFKTYLDKEEHGIKTRAALLGISHRHKGGKVTEGQPRQSFEDTFTYRNSFRVWAE